jgi:hypothetical protein
MSAMVESRRSIRAAYFLQPPVHHGGTTAERIRAPLTVTDNLGPDWRNSGWVHPGRLADAGAFGGRRPSGVVLKATLAFAIAIVPALFSPIREKVNARFRLRHAHSAYRSAAAETFRARRRGEPISAQLNSAASADQESQTEKRGAYGAAWHERRVVKRGMSAMGRKRPEADVSSSHQMARPGSPSITRCSSRGRSPARQRGARWATR